MIGVVDLSNNHFFATLVGHKEKVTSMAFSPDGKSLVLTSEDKTASVWDVPAPNMPPFDLKGIGQEMFGRWEATPVVEDILLRPTLKRQGVPDDKLDAAVMQMRQMKTGLTLAYTFEAYGNVTVLVTASGKPQEHKGDWEIVNVRGNTVKVPLTGGGNPPDLLVLHMKEDDPDRLNSVIPDTPVRQPVEFQRVK